MTKFVLAALLGACLMAAILTIVSLDRTTRQTRRGAAEVSEALKERATLIKCLKCETDLNASRAELKLCSVLSNADYYVWEVHALSKDPGRLEPAAAITLCDSMPAHSTYRAGTSLASYNLWNDPGGQLMLGCQYAHTRETPP